MLSLAPPKTPLKLGLYCLAIAIATSFLWAALGLPTSGTGKSGFILLFILGFLYGRTHGNVLSTRTAFFACLWFIIPILALGYINIFVDGSPDISDFSSKDAPLLLMILLGLVLMIALQVCFLALGLWGGSKLAVHLSKANTQK
jgi:hypothetical protein